MPSLICTTKSMEVGWEGHRSSQLFLQLHFISQDAEGDRGNKRVWIPISQCHPNHCAPMHNEAPILTIFFFTKSLERHRHSFTAFLQSPWLQRAALTLLLTYAWSPWGSALSYGAVQVSELHNLYIQGQDTALDTSALLMGFFYPFFCALHLFFLFFMWHASLEARYWAICNKQRHHLVVPGWWAHCILWWRNASWQL